MIETTVEGASDSDDEDMLTTESFFMTCKIVGLTLDDMEYMTIGQCLDYVDEYFRIRNGDKEDAPRKGKQADFDAF